MSRKGFIIIGLAALLATTGGVAFASNNDVRPTAGTSSLTESTLQTVDDSDAQNNGEYVEYYDEVNEDIHNASSSQEDALPDETVAESLYDNTDESETVPIDCQDDSETSARELIYEFSVQQVIDHNSGEPVAPQVVFGKYYRSCYLKLYDDDSFELCLNPSSEKAETGAYTIEDDDLIVNFGDNKLDSYRILYDENNEIDTIIISSGKYIIYFN